MNTGTVMETLAKEYPLRMAMDWDNSGIQVGRPDREVTRILVALDATDAVLKECIEWGAQMLVTHHPLLLSGIRRVYSEDMIGRKILLMAENGITHYAMHTNYDVLLMGEMAGNAMNLADTEVLEVTNKDEGGKEYGIGCVGSLPQEMSAKDCCACVKRAFGLKTIRLFGSQETMVERVAVSPGSGKSMIGAALKSGAQLLITGDIGHHDGIDAVDQGLIVIDAGHYGVEQIFIGQMEEFLGQRFPALEVRKARTSESFLVL